MNKFFSIKMLFIFLLLLKKYEYFFASQVCQILTQIPITQNQISIIPAYLYLNLQSYQAGGLVFTFPANTFTQIPTARVSLYWQNFNTSTIYQAYVTSITTSSVTVSVNAIDEGISLGTHIREANTNEIQVAVLVSGI